MQQNDQNQTSDGVAKIGKGMWFAAWIMGIFLLTVFFDDQLEKQENPNQNPDSRVAGDYTEVILKRNRFGHYISSGEINGHPVVFMLDTGATGVSIPQEIAQSIGLRKGAAFQTYTANGIGTGYRTGIDSLSIGNISVGAMDAGIAPNMPGGQVLLGMSVLKQLEFTQRGDQLILRQYR